MDLNTLKKEIEAKKGVLVDVREKHEWDEGHIEGAIFAPLSELFSYMDSLPKDKHLYLYCRSGGRVIQAASLLKSKFHVTPLSWGYQDLVYAGFKK